MFRLDPDQTHLINRIRTRSHRKPGSATLCKTAASDPGLNLYYNRTITISVLLLAQVLQITERKKSLYFRKIFSFFQMTYCMTIKYLKKKHRNKWIYVLLPYNKRYIFNVQHIVSNIHTMLSIEIRQHWTPCTILLFFAIFFHLPKRICYQFKVFLSVSFFTLNELFSYNFKYLLSKLWFKLNWN